MGCGDVIECLVKLKSGKIVRLNYNNVDEFWYYPSTDEIPATIKKDCSDIVAWVNCKEVDKDLECDADRNLAWNFGTELMDRAIPALTLWIDKGISHQQILISIHGKICLEKFVTHLSRLTIFTQTNMISYLLKIKRISAM